jgi:hypothetical protein
MKFKSCRVCIYAYVSMYTSYVKGEGRSTRHNTYNVLMPRSIQRAPRRTTPGSSGWRSPSDRCSRWADERGRRRDEGLIDGRGAPIRHTYARYIYYSFTHAYSPSYMEISDACSTSSHGTHGYVLVSGCK